jgi:hypothetical protein
MKPARQSTNRAAWALCIAACAIAFQAYAQSIPTESNAVENVKGISTMRVIRERPDPKELLA